MNDEPYIPELLCPVCNKEAGSIGKNDKPKRGDSMVCCNCASVLIFDLRLREPTLTELLEWSPEEHAMVERVMQEVMARRRAS